MSWEFLHQDKRTSDRGHSAISRRDRGRSAAPASPGEPQPGVGLGAVGAQVLVEERLAFNEYIPSQRARTARELLADALGSGAHIRHLREATVDPVLLNSPLQVAARKDLRANRRSASDYDLSGQHQRYFGQGGGAQDVFDETRTPVVSNSARERQKERGATAYYDARLPLQMLKYPAVLPKPPAQASPRRRRRPR